MEAQYYTPTPEEFHVGFEYENFVKHEGWTKRTLESLSDYGFNEKGFCIDHEDYRVKCLDEQDIIDLWWSKKDIANIYELVPFWEGRSEKGVNVTIFKKYETEHGYLRKTIFNGNIKNKSELKRIMQMLKIIE
jgi:hypothetical protein